MLKEHTALIQPESEDDEAEDEEKDEDEEAAAQAEADLIEASKETSQALGTKKTSTSKQLDIKGAQ